MQRGTLVIVSLSGDYGKPRPAVVVQAQPYLKLASVVVCPLTSALLPDDLGLRVIVDPSAANGLLERSAVMIDKISAVPVQRLGAVIGQADDAALAEIDNALTIFLGLA
jgi:mRNA interferase MazF